MGRGRRHVFGSPFSPKFSEDHLPRELTLREAKLLALLMKARDAGFNREPLTDQALSKLKTSLLYITRRWKPGGALNKKAMPK